MTRVPSSRAAFYTAFFTATVCYGLQLGFFWTIFGPVALFLWMILGFWIGLFVVLSQRWQRHASPKHDFVALPIFWMGLEYIRSELYPLKFSWFTLGSPLVESVLPAAHHLGSYGIGAIMCFIAVWVHRQANRWQTFYTAILAGILFGFGAYRSPQTADQPNQSDTLTIGGIQLEFPTEATIIHHLNRLLESHPQVDLIVLSEYSIQSTPSPNLKRWCRDNQKHLLIGGRDPIDQEDYYNTAFVISPQGTIPFKQGKSEPIQFFADGQPAPTQKLWHSPWGKIGIAVCYDLSFTRVIDNLARQGAQHLIIPTMDVADWGRREHELHARIAPVRAREYQIPIFRVASSGISQSIDRRGFTRATAPFPGQGEQLVDEITLTQSAYLPFDRYVAPAASLGVLIFILALAIPDSIKARCEKLSSRLRF